MAHDVSSIGRYICEACGSRQATAGFCAQHPDEPLLDLADEDVRLLLDEFDDRRRAQRYTVIAVTCAILLSPLLLLGLVKRFFIVVWAGAVTGLTAGIYRIFPARQVLPNLEHEWPEWMDE